MNVQAQVRAALQQVRERTPRECDVVCKTTDYFAPLIVHSEACTDDWTARVDARLAACVEAGFLAVAELVAEADCLMATTPDERKLQAMYKAADEAGLAAFLAAASQGEST